MTYTIRATSGQYWTGGAWSYYPTVADAMTYDTLSDLPESIPSPHDDPTRMIALQIHDEAEQMDARYYAPDDGTAEAVVVRAQYAEEAGT